MPPEIADLLWAFFSPPSVAINMVVPFLVTLVCAVMWGGDGILIGYAGWIALELAIALPNPFQAENLGLALAALAAGFSGVSLLWCLTGLPGGIVGLRIRSRRLRKTPG
jgi:hypothetical protein